jgi:iron complex outermembrane receptor protein
MKNSVKRLLGRTALLVAVLGAVGSISLPAQAQQASNTASDRVADDSGEELQEIIVTARKREENLQSVPVDITAISGAELIEKSIKTPVDLQYDTPGLEVRTAGNERSSLQFFIRGQGQTFGSTPSVVTYFSEAPQGNDQLVSIGNNSQFFDLSSVQVLKGPQGTLFGRSTTGGAVLFTPQHPTDEYEASVRAEAGDFGSHEFNIVLNAPLIDDVLKVRFATNIVRRDGFTRSLTTGQNLDDENRDSFRVSLSYTPTGWFDSFLLYQYNRANEDNTGAVLQQFNPNFSEGGIPVYNASSPITIGTIGLICSIVNPGNAAGQAACTSQRLGTLGALSAGLSAEQARVSSGGNDAVRYDVTGGPLTLQGANDQLLNITKVDAGQYGFLGDVSFKNVFSTLRTLGVRSVYDFGSPLPNGTVYNNIGLQNFLPSFTQGADGRDHFLDQFSEEFQILGSVDGGKDTWILGYYLEENFQPLLYPPLFSALGNVFSLTQVPYPTVVSTFSKDQLDLQRGYFGQTTVDLSDWVLRGLHATGGFRWSESQFHQLSLNPDPVALAAGNLLPGTVSTSTPPSVDDRAPSWTFSLDYQITPTVMTYVSEGRGFKAGGANIAPSSPIPNYQPTYAPEKVDNIELGFKADWSIGPTALRTNVALYKEWYNDIQRSEVLPSGVGGAPYTQTANIAKAELEGVEFDGLWRATRHLQFSLNYSYTDARYTEWPGTVTTPTGQVLPLVDSPYVGTPKHQGTVGAHYEMPLPDRWGQFTGLVEYYRQSEVWLSDTALADGFGLQKGYGNMNLRLDWRNVQNTNLDLAFFMTNVTNEVHAQSINSVYGEIGIINAIFNPPRMWGFELQYRIAADKK